MSTAAVPLLDDTPEYREAVYSISRDPHRAYEAIVLRDARVRQLERQCDVLAKRVDELEREKNARE